MLIMRYLIIACCLFNCWCANQRIIEKHRFNGFPINNVAQKLKNRLKINLNRYREKNTQRICYDIVGCFSLPYKNSPLQRIPEDPKYLNTKFYLFTRLNITTPEVVLYNDNRKTLDESNFNYSNPLKLIIHGYTGRWDGQGSLKIAESYLTMHDYNVILMDWQIGAKGPPYLAAAANTEVVGKELGILLRLLVKNGLNPKQIHLIGFSLGAHVAGVASESLKDDGYLIGRITGLDAASPLFRNNRFKEKHKKLDRSDAEFVDALHTDSSPFLTDGFGLWEPIGHVDYFANGGQEQPGCQDLPNSVVATRIEGHGLLNKDTACSHLRAYHLYAERVENEMKRSTGKNKNQCQFIAYNCPGGLLSFDKGYCFPIVANNSQIYDMGEFSEEILRKDEGIMYFSTRATPPYCGRQLQISLHISQNTPNVMGILMIDLNYFNRSVNFQIFTDLKDLTMSGSRMSGLAVAEYNSMNPKILKNIDTRLSFYPLNLDEAPKSVDLNSTVYIDKIVVRDMFGNSWQHCKKDLDVSDKYSKNIILSSISC